MRPNPVVENALALPRVAKTLLAARAFDKSAVPPHATPGQSQFNMRSSMNLDPRLGKSLSKLSFRKASGEAWKLADPGSSRFIDVTEVDQAAAGVQRDGFYVFQKTDICEKMKCPHKRQFRRVTIYISGAKFANDLVYRSDLFQE